MFPLDDLGHYTRGSDSSYYDLVCVHCGATDGHTDEGLKYQCSEPDKELFRHGGKYYRDEYAKWKKEQEEQQAKDEEIVFIDDDSELFEADTETVIVTKLPDNWGAF